MTGLKATYIDHMGSDLTVVNNARVSFAKQSDWAWSDEGQALKKADQGLIRFLADGMRTKELDLFLDEVGLIGESWIFGGESGTKEALWAKLKRFRRTPTHWVPFANGVQMQFHVEAPIPIMRQVFKHKVGAVESEESRRYISETPTIFRPEFRRAAENVKQGSSDEVFEPDPMYVPMPVMVNGEVMHGVVAIGYDVLTSLSTRWYDHAIAEGVCPEQARFGLVQGAVTQARICNSLYGWANFYNARSDVQHAQREVAVLAEQVAEVARKLFPVSWAALTE